jgi:type 1 fimbria pilin
LHASGWDLEDRFLPDSAFTWQSSLAGSIGTGRQIFVSSLEPGAHTLTLKGTDSSGLFVERTVNITVTARTLYASDIDRSGAVDGGDLAILLSDWAGSGAGDINFDGTVDGIDLALLISHWMT